MDPAQRPTPIVEPEETFAERAYLRLPDVPQSAEERETPSGEYHRLTLEAIERSPDAEIPIQRSAAPPPVEDQLPGVPRQPPRGIDAGPVSSGPGRHPPAELWHPKRGVDRRQYQY